MTFIGLFFAVLLMAAIRSMAKIQRAELLEARAKREAACKVARAREARLEEFRAKCYRPDGD